MGSVVIFFANFEKGVQKQSPTKTKDAHVINVANLNYCGIMKSPFEFYSGKFQPILQELSHRFNQIRKLYVKQEQGQPFAWQFSKLDKKIKERYCPFYNINCGIEKGKFVTKQRFIEIWKQVYQEQEKVTNSKFSEAEQEEALKFDLIAFHTLLSQVYKIPDLDQAVNHNPKQYLHFYTPFFNQSFLNEKKKLQKFKLGMQQSMADVVFVQEPDDLLINDLQKFKDKYFISVSSDKDTLIFAKKQRFSEQKETSHMLSRLNQQEQAELNWNQHSAYMFLDNYFLISGHLNSKKAENQVNVKELMNVMPKVVEKYHDLDIIAGLDANSFIPDINKQIPLLNAFPDDQKIFTTVKKRTSMQVQTSKAEKMIQENKDLILTTLPLKLKDVFSITGQRITKDLFLPLEEHPFDHYLVFVVVEEKRHK